MRLAFVLPSFAGGGAERAVLTLLRALPRDRVTPCLVVVDGRGPLSSLLPNDVPVRDLRATRVRQAILGLRGALRDADVIVPTIGYLNLAVLALRPLLKGARIFPREANLPSVSLRALPAGGTLAYRLLYPRASGVLCNATPVAEELRALGVRRVHHLDNPIDEDAIRIAAARRPRESGAGPRFIAAGRLTQQKGFDRLIDMFVRQDGHLTILGDGPDRAALETRIRQHGLERRVTLAGYTENPWPRYAGADAFLLPSRWEGMPNAALEALACGTPVIATPEAGGAREIGDSVTIADWPRGFSAAMAAVRPDGAGALRPSLLPRRFAASTVASYFLTIIGA